MVDLDLGMTVNMWVKRAGLGSGGAGSELWLCHWLELSEFPFNHL